MKLRPVLSAGTIGVLIAAASALPSFATDDETPRERVVSETPATPSPEAEEDPTPTPTSDITSKSAEPSNAATADEEEDEEEDNETPSPSILEHLLEATTEPVVRPSVQAAEPSSDTPEAPVTPEASNNPRVEANSNSNPANNDSANAEANSQPLAANPQNPGSANGEVSNSNPNSNSGSNAQTERDNPGTSPQEALVSPLNLPIAPAQNVQFFGADTLAQALFNSQNSDDNAPVEEITTGTSDAPGRIESRRIVRPDEPSEAVTQDSSPAPLDIPSTPPDAPSTAPEDIRSSPQEELVRTGAMTTTVGIGGVLLIAAGIALLSWRHRTNKTGSLRD